MSKMKPYIILLFVCRVALAETLQDRGRHCDELEPCVYTYYACPEYQIQVGNILFDNIHRRHEFQMLSHHAFGFETLLSVGSEEDKYFAEVVTPNTPIWDAVMEGSDLGELHVLRKEKVIPVSMAGKAADVWHSMVLRTKFPTYRQSQTVDGAMYVFISRINHPYSGRSISANCLAPDLGTKPDLLAKIGESIIEYVSAKPDSEKKIEENIYRLMDQLEHELKIEKWVLYCKYAVVLFLVISCLILLLRVRGSECQSKRK